MFTQEEVDAMLNGLSRNTIDENYENDLPNGLKESTISFCECYIYEHKTTKELNFFSEQIPGKIHTDWTFLGVHKMDIERVQKNVEQDLLSRLERGAKAIEAISWALGEGDSNFGDNKPDNAPPFWWRKELRRRAGKDGK